MAFYIYQLLPNGDRIELCNVVDSPPFNVIGSGSFTFGETSACGLGNFDLGSLIIDQNLGFEACDGALLEIEAVLFITDNLNFDPLTESVYSALNANEIISIDLGTLEINVNNEFPGGGLPLTTAIINDYDTGSEGPLTVNCGEDVNLYVEGISRLANCVSYNDITTGITSELANTFSYTFNGGLPIIIDSAAGGQLSGPDPAFGDICYGGILTPNSPLTIAEANLPFDLCEGSTLIFTISTTDLFTGVTVSDDITVIYSGADCTACSDMQGCTDNTACNFDATATTDDGSCLFNDCEGNCGGTALAGTSCIDGNGNAGTYTTDCACTICQEEITGTISAAADCDVSGIEITIIAPDGTSINIITESDGSFTIPGGPFPCGVYTAAFFDPGQLPFCYSETGEVDPITFLLDGMDTEENDVEFAANPNIPTLSQWGIIIMILMLMCVGAIQSVRSTYNFSLGKS